MLSRRMQNSLIAIGSTVSAISTLATWAVNNSANNNIEEIPKVSLLLATVFMAGLGGFTTHLIYKFVELTNRHGLFREPNISKQAMQFLSDNPQNIAIEGRVAPAA